MPTDNQIAAKLKKDQADLSRGIIAHVASAALHILHESYLFETSLWPSKGFKVGFRSGNPENNSIIYSARISYENGVPCWQAIYFNCMNKSERRCINQQRHISMIMDDAIYDNVHFNYYEINPGMYYAIVCPFTELYYSQLIFKFTISE